MRIIVQKFGGTSVADEESREKVADRIEEAISEGYRTVVVLSAIGREGAPYATDTLIKFASGISPMISEREQDLLMSCGEIISCVAMAQTLRNRGLDAVSLTGLQAGIYTDGHYGDARIKKIDPKKIIDVLSQGKIALVAGFQGGTEDGEINTLGRGGSDTTATALGAAMDADMVDIFTDVDGIMTADPRIVESARILESVSYGELCQMAQLGAKVIHPRAVEIAMQKNIPVRVRSTFSDAEGTLITNCFNEGEISEKTAGDRLVTGVAHISGIAQLKISVDGESNRSLAELNIFKSMAANGISVDLINVYPEQAVFTISEKRLDDAEKLLSSSGYIFEVRSGCAKVSIVGAGMHGIPGVMARVVSSMYESKIDILQTADSHTTISCLVDKENMIKAVNALHNEFGLIAQ